MSTFTLKVDPVLYSSKEDELERRDVKYHTKKSFNQMDKAIYMIFQDIHNLNDAKSIIYG